jgi:hypothetical protein
MESSHGWPVLPESSLDDFLLEISGDDRRALARLIMERNKAKSTWSQMLVKYAQIVQEAPLFSLSGDVAKDVDRIQRLQNVERLYGPLDTYFRI